MDRAKLKAELIRDEGDRLTSYKDSKGYWTIGIGHLLGEVPGPAISDAERDAFYEEDVAAAEKMARRVVPEFDRLDDVRQRALVNMAFNRGGHMRSSTTIVPAINDAISTGDWHRVAKAIAASPWAAQVGARAGRLAMMFETGTA